MLVICKKSAFQFRGRQPDDDRVRLLLKAGDPSLERKARAHREHVGSIAEARKVLAALGARAVFRFRGSPLGADAFDLMVTLGGDGTLLWASHLVGSDCPVVAVNTAPSDSTGHFCAGTKHELAAVLEDALAGRLAGRSLTRMRVTLDGESVCSRVLNDALFCHLIPAATTRYTIRLGRLQEEHKSSGVWVGPGAGSTAAQRAAGGRSFGATSRRLQFVVRELSNAGTPGCGLCRGFVEPGRELCISSRIRRGRLYLDGPHLSRAVYLGSELRMGVSAEPLTLLGFVASTRARR